MKGRTIQFKKNSKRPKNKRNKCIKTQSGVMCKIKKDESVERLLSNSKNREKIKGVIKGIVDFFCKIFSIMFFTILSVTVFNSVFYKLKPTFLGYTTCRIVTASMVNSGFEVNDKAIIRAVDTSTLRGARIDENGEKIWGDIIAFYVDPENKTDASEFNQITNFDYDIKYIDPLNTIFRMPSYRLKQLAKGKATIFFHHIENVYVDSSGKRWFSTMGSSNTKIDQEKINTEDGFEYLNSGYVSEDVILGVYDEGSNSDGFARVVTKIAESRATMPVLLLFSILLLIVGLSDVFVQILSYYYTTKLLAGNLDPTDKKVKKFRVYENLSDYEKLQILQDYPVEESAEILASLFFIPDDKSKRSKENAICLDKDYKSKNPNYDELKKIYARKRIELMTGSKKDKQILKS